MRPILGEVGAATALGWIAGALLAASPAAWAAQPPRPAVVELFTSEGCSSCPPAEAYLGELARRSDVLALAYHVDYWDDLGWRDPFALPEATRRQRHYAQALRLASIYTPEVIVDGEADFLGNDRPAIARSLARARTGIAVALALRNDRLLVEVGAEGGGAPSDILLIAYRRAAVSAVGRGENAGRTLEEFNVVREVRAIGRWNGERRQFEASVGSLPADVTDLAVIVQPLGQAPILGAARIALHAN